VDPRLGEGAPARERYCAHAGKTAKECSQVLSRELLLDCLVQASHVEAAPACAAVNPIGQLACSISCRAKHQVYHSAVSLLSGAMVALTAYQCEKHPTAERPPASTSSCNKVRLCRVGHMSSRFVCWRTTMLSLDFSRKDRPTMSALAGSPQRLALITPNRKSPRADGALLHYSWARAQFCALLVSSGDAKGHRKFASPRAGITVRVSMPSKGASLGVAWWWWPRSRANASAATDSESDAICARAGHEKVSASCLPQRAGADRGQARPTSASPTSTRTTGLRAVKDKKMCVTRFSITRYHEVCGCKRGCLLAISWSRDVAFHGLVVAG